MQDFTESVRELMEDAILEGLYEQFPENEVNAFLKDLDDEIISTGMLQAIEDLEELIEERINDLIEQKTSYKDDE